MRCVRVDICVISSLFLIYERDERAVVRCTSLLPGKRFSTNSSSFDDVFCGANNDSLKAQAMLTTFAPMNVLLSNHHHIRTRKKNTTNTLSVCRLGS